MRSITSTNSYSKSKLSLLAKSDRDILDMKPNSAYFAGARKKNEKLKNYFDEDDDDESPEASAPTILPDDDYDPLDAFMFVF